MNKEQLAFLAGDIAAGMVSNPAFAKIPITDTQSVSRTSVLIARGILREIDATEGQEQAGTASAG